MRFFNETASEYVQFASMIFEVVGITLAYIEIRYKPLAIRIESKFQAEEGRVRDYVNKLAESKLSVVLITIFITIFFFVEIPYLAGLYDKIIPSNWHFVEQWVIWVTVPVLVMFIALIGTILMGDFVSWLNRFSRGHAIGALGVVITAIGLMGDTYQAITILVNRSAIA